MAAAQQPKRRDLGGAQLANFPAVPARSAMPGWYVELLSTVSGRIEVGRRRAVAAVNQELATTYWAIGRDILDRQDEQGWRSKVIDRLSADLRERFPRARGYSPRNLKYMRAFATAWEADSIVQAPLAQLPWYHHLALIEKLPDESSRLWYAAAAIEYGWSRDILVHHIQTGFRERFGNAVTNFAATLPPADSGQAQQATRDPYLFDFLGIAYVRREHDLKYVRAIAVGWPDLDIVQRSVAPLPWRQQIASIEKLPHCQLWWGASAEFVRSRPVSRGGWRARARRDDEPRWVAGGDVEYLAGCVS